MEHEMLAWFLAMLLFAILEASTASLVSVWFIIGAFSALISTMCGAPLWMQLVIFFGVSILTLLCVRPLMKKQSQAETVATNADSSIGKIAVVTERIDNIHATGAVKVGSVVWTARSESGAVIEPEALVVVRRIEGVKLYVEPQPAPVK